MTVGIISYVSIHMWMSEKCSDTYVVWHETNLNVWETNQELARSGQSKKSKVKKIKKRLLIKP